MAGKVVSDAELSDEAYSSSEASDFENYSQKTNKTTTKNVIKKVNTKIKTSRFLSMFTIFRML